MKMCCLVSEVWKFKNHQFMSYVASTANRFAFILFSLADSLEWFSIKWLLKTPPHFTVMKVYNDLLLAADNGDVSALCLLDLTAAFDTVHHDLMMLKLERQFGLRGVVWDWLRSYLCGRTYLSHPRWQDVMYCSRCMFRASRFCSMAVHVHYNDEWSIIYICVINVTGNCFCTQSSTCNPPSCPQFCQMLTDLKSIFAGRLVNKFVKNIAIENFITQMCS